MGQGRIGRPQTDREGDITLNSTRPVCGAGSGIVTGPDRVRRGEEGETEGGGWGAGTEAAPEVMGHYPCGGSAGEGREVLADFHGLQMLNMQMSNRIVRQ